MFQQYKAMFEDSGSNPGDRTLEDKFFENEVTSTRPTMFCNVFRFSLLRYATIYHTYMRNDGAFNATNILCLSCNTA